MTFASGLFICCGGIAICAALVFVVETLVAFCLHEEESFVHPRASLLSIEQGQQEFSHEEAA